MAYRALSPGERVAGIYELRNEILSHLSTRELFLCQAVDPAWRAAIQTSQAFQIKTFQAGDKAVTPQSSEKPSLYNSVRLNPLVPVVIGPKVGKWVKKFSCRNRQSPMFMIDLKHTNHGRPGYADVTISLPDVSDNSTAAEVQPSWRNVKISNPPMKSLAVITQETPGAVWYRTERHWSTVSNDTGLTFGDLADARFSLIVEHQGPDQGRPVVTFCFTVSFDSHLNDWDSGFFSFCSFPSRPGVRVRQMDPTPWRLLSSQGREQFKQRKNEQWTARQQMELCKQEMNWRGAMAELYENLDDCVFQMVV